ncbi:SecDF P1 head subdomain-containing protein [Streptomyces griseorubiginosus]|uniref:SecDF P1 head subdomain-containing protein n=1 Tax=Streptomyces griseorubiginosus TaxID=67304 RepID=UPI0036E6C2FD
MNDSTGDLLHETLLHDTLHTHVRERDGDAGAHLVGLADGALRVARRRQRLTRAGAGVALAAAVATAWVAVADDGSPRAHVVQPAHRGDAAKATTVSLLPVTSATEGPCTQGDGGYSVKATAAVRAMCFHTDSAKGMRDIRVASAKAENSTVDGGWHVEATLSSADRTRFATLTGSLASAPLPRNQFAIVIDGKLWGYPHTVTGSITGGRFVVVGPYGQDPTGATAHNLAQRLDPGR